MYITFLKHITFHSWEITAAVLLIWCYLLLFFEGFSKALPGTWHTEKVQMEVVSEPIGTAPFSGNVCKLQFSLNHFSRLHQVPLLTLIGTLLVEAPAEGLAKALTHNRCVTEEPSYLALNFHIIFPALHMYKSISCRRVLGQLHFYRAMPLNLCSLHIAMYVQEVHHQCSHLSNAPGAYILYH